jgi:Mor family transcriptional regulator
MENNKVIKQFFPRYYDNTHQSERNKEIYELRKSGKTMREVAEMYSVSQSRVYGIVKAIDYQKKNNNADEVNN